MDYDKTVELYKQAWTDQEVAGESGILSSQEGRRPGMTK